MFGFFATARLLFALRNFLDVFEVSDLEVLRDGDIALFDFDFLFAICRRTSSIEWTDLENHAADPQQDRRGDQR
jgi:hypothetical protein